MKLNLEQLKKKFVSIKDIRNKVTTIFEILENHLTKLKNTYSDFVVNNRQHLFVFGLDSFQFQSKLIDIEYADMKRLFLAINNRMYCEYYKLYKIISDYVNKNISDKKILDIIRVINTFPVYKDLEPYKQYNFEMIQEIHENNILLLYGINEYIVNKESELQIHQTKQANGLNINNFVTTFNYNILMIKEKGLLFISYIEFFHALHTKYLQRFSMKMNLMYTQVTHDIRFDDSPKTSDIKKEELINNFQNDQVDNSLIKQIRKSFDDSEQNSNDYDSPNSHSTFSNNENELLINNVYSKNIPEQYDLNYMDPKNINNSETEPQTKSQSKLKKIFTKNVIKMVGGIFKKKGAVNKNLSSVSTDSINNNIEQIELLKYKNLSSSRDLSLQSNESSINSLNKINENVVIKIDEKNEEKNPILINPITFEDEEELKRTLSQDNIFLEITKQCNEITLDFKNDNYVIQSETIDPICSIIIDQNVDGILTEKHLDDNMSVITMDTLNNKNVQKDTNVQEDKNVQEDDNKNVQEDDNTNVQEDDNKNVQEDDNKNVQEETNEIKQEETNEIKQEDEIKKKKQYKPRKKKNV